jgi:hypothetical protein
MCWHAHVDVCVRVRAFLCVSVGVCVYVCVRVYVCTRVYFSDTRLLMLDLSEREREREPFSLTTVSNLLYSVMRQTLTWLHILTTHMIRSSKILLLNETGCASSVTRRYYIYWEDGYQYCIRFFHHECSPVLALINDIE